MNMMIKLIQMKFLFIYLFYKTQMESITRLKKMIKQNYYFNLYISYISTSRFNKFEYVYYKHMLI